MTVKRYTLGMTIERVNTTLGLASADLMVVVLNTITFVLGLLGLIQTIMVLYAGFILLGAGQNEERRHEAKMTILRSVVGVVIVGAAWAIVQFLFRAVGDAAT